MYVKIVSEANTTVGWLINEKFSKLIGYSNEEIYQQKLDDFVISWISINFINDNKTKAKNIYKTKTDKTITLNWFNIKIDKCYYCIGKVFEEEKDLFIDENFKSLLKIDSTMTKIINSYNSKKELSILLQVSIYKLNQIINNKELYNNFYYMKYTDCPRELINIYELQ